jgi:hypothetical protein
MADSKENPSIAVVASNPAETGRDAAATGPDSKSQSISKRWNWRKMVPPGSRKSSARSTAASGGTNTPAVRSSIHLRDTTASPVMTDGSAANIKLSTTAPPSVTVDSAMAVPISELWNEAWDDLKTKNAALVKEYEEHIEKATSRYAQSHVTMSVMRTTNQSVVAFSGLGKLQRAQEMRGLLENRIKELEQGQWKVGFGENQFTVKEFIKPVVGFIDQSKDYIATAAEASPYASLAWAGVSLLLPVSSSSVARHKDFIKLELERRFILVL